MVNFSKKMSLMEAAKFQKITGRRPNDIIIATEEPMRLNEVVQLYGFNMIVDKELTKEEFYHIHEENIKKSRYTIGLTTLIGAKFDMENEKEHDGYPPDSCKYYYKLKFQHA